MTRLTADQRAARLDWWRAFFARRRRGRWGRWWGEVEAKFERNVADRERARGEVHADGCRWVRTHDMRYIGQGVWRCADCGYEPPQLPDVPGGHNHGWPAHEHTVGWRP